MAILVVPAAAHVDASTVAAELSLSMAQTFDLPVVAIDADLDRAAAESEPAVATAGFADVLIDRVDWRSVLASARDERVKHLTAGRPVAATESVAPATARLGPIVAEIKTRYRCLIVHGGVPTNPLTGALVQACDLVYLVVRLGQTTRRAARTAKRTLQRGGALVHGSILLAGP
jgi:Mrp family chromosome partitioning ATPase